MAILNYTTKVEPDKTVVEIQAILVRHRVRQISVDYGENGVVDAVRFTILRGEIPLHFRLPCNVEGVLKALVKAKETSSKHCTQAHARRVAWRIIKDWIEAQLALVEAQQAEMAEVFLPYTIDDSGVSLFSALMESKQKQLTAGTP